MSAVEIPALTDEIRAQLRTEYASRFPQVAPLPLTGDGGNRVVVTAVLVNPLSARAPKDGETIGGVWPFLVQEKEAPNFAEQIVNECVVWPDRAARAAWFARWPDLVVDLANAVMKKIGREGSNVVRPADDEQPPDALLGVLEAFPRASWRRVKLSATEQLAVVLDPPSGAAWRITKQQYKATADDAWRAKHGLVLACTKGSVTLDGEARPIAAVLEERPGLGLVLPMAITALVGVAETYELGKL